ncbi:MAG TPA: ankyrin repeat domain-containing protein [Chlamydiales bacterium]|nr:ankyrin repeat domain-containing protein [Chlamydiales bacterium]
MSVSTVSAARRTLPQPSVQDQFEEAVNYGHLDLATELLEFAGAQINDQSAWNQSTPLIRELRGQSREEVVAFLLDNGARVDLADNGGETPLHVAAEHFNTRMVRLLLKYNPPINAQDNKGQTPLHLTVRNYNDDTMNLLVEGGGANINLPDKEGTTPLGYCCSWGRYDRAKYFFDKGADVNPTTEKDCGPFYGALYRCKKEEFPFDQLALDMIPKLNDVNRPNCFGDCYLHLCVGRHKFDLNGPGLDRTPHINALLEKTADVNCQDRRGYTPLHLAVQGRKEDLLPIFIAAKADINKPSQGGLTPVQTAARDGSEGIVRYLLENHAIVPEDAQKAFDGGDFEIAISHIKKSIPIPKSPAKTLDKEDLRYFVMA